MKGNLTNTAAEQRERERDGAALTRLNQKDHSDMQKLHYKNCGFHLTIYFYANFDGNI